jgi:protein farnesyltransferase/geranylgeranyltransferase type-1 subunit alpha
MKRLKSYQIWGHRQSIMSLMPSVPADELSFLARILAKDAKNYHVWSYRQWLVERFKLYPTPENPGPELPFIESLLITDVRNNSAWNHRYYVLFGRTGQAETSLDQTFMDEIEYTKGKIALAPQNASAWNYLRGVLKKRGSGIGDLEGFALQYASVEDEKLVRSSHALDFLAQVWEEKNASDKAIKALDLLSAKFDPIRSKYWEYRKLQLNTELVS